MRPIQRDFAHGFRMEEHEMLFPDPFHFVLASIPCSYGLLEDPDEHPAEEFRAKMSSQTAAASCFELLRLWLKPHDHGKARRQADVADRA